MSGIKRDQFPGLRRPLPLNVPHADLLDLDYHEKFKAWQNSLVAEDDHDATKGVQEYLNEYGPQRITALDGRTWFVLAAPAGDETRFDKPFEVTQVEGEAAIQVQVGEINNSWEGSGTIPTLNGTSLAAATPPTLEVPSGTNYLRGRLVVTPTSVARGGGYAMSSLTTTEDWDFDFYTDSDARLPEIDEDTGSVVQTGIFYRLIAVVTRTNVSGQPRVTISQTRYGPINVGFCPASRSIQDAPVGLAFLTLL